jgi:glycosyltransferase involved in cell wall biosynthesis
MRYLITVPAAGHRTSTHTFALESAFATHLRELKQELGTRCQEIVVAMAELDAPSYEKLKHELSSIDEAVERIRFVPLHRYGCSKLEFLRGLPRHIQTISQLVYDAHFVHSHFSYDLFRPIGALFCAFGVATGKPVIAVDDIDRRRDAEMFHHTGRWSKRTYLMSKHLYDPARDWLQRAYVRQVDMMLFKELQQVEDYGGGKDHVRLFLDPNFAAEHVVSDAFVAAKTRALRDSERPLRVLYFGRLVPYKGVDKMVEAVAQARARGARLEFDIMGSGEQENALRAQCERLGLQNCVRFIAPRPYGQEFFAVLREHDVLLACPLSGDTPRSAWDALASGMPLLAFDTPFYQSMASISRAVQVTPWPEVASFADALLALAQDKTKLLPMVHDAVRAARENSGKTWLKRRVAWVDELLEMKAPHRHVHEQANAHHDSQNARSAIREQRQRDAHHRQEPTHHAEVNNSLPEDQRRHADRNDRTKAVLGL